MRKHNRDSSPSPVEYQNKSPTESDEFCMICLEGFTSLHPPYPMGYKCNLESNKHKYHSSCLSIYYKSELNRTHNNLKNIIPCILCSKPLDDSLERKITQEFLNDVNTRAAQEDAAQYGHKALQDMALQFNFKERTHREKAILDRLMELSAHKRMDAYKRKKSRSLPHSAVQDTDPEVSYQNDRANEKSVQNIGNMEAAARLSTAETKAFYNPYLNNQEEPCSGKSCNVMGGGKFRKTRRKTSRKGRRKTRRKISRKTRRI